MIAWAIASKPGASGSYELDFSTSDIMGAGECGSYGTLVAGNGRPSYLISGFQGCITTTVLGSITANSTKYTIASAEFHGITTEYTFATDELYFLIYGFTNSTQTTAVG